MTNMTKYVGTKDIEIAIDGVMRDSLAAGKLVGDLLKFVHQSVVQVHDCLASHISSITLAPNSIIVKLSLPSGTTLEQIASLDGDLSSAAMLSLGYLTDTTRMKRVRLKHLSLDDVDVVSIVDTRQCVEKFIVKTQLPSDFDVNEYHTMVIKTYSDVVIAVFGRVVAHDEQSFTFQGIVKKREEKPETNAKRAMRDLRRLGITLLDTETPTTRALRDMMEENGIDFPQAQS